MAPSGYVLAGDYTLRDAGPIKTSRLVKGPLRPLVERLLLRGQFADRRICNADGVKAVVRDHYETRVDRTWLLLALMTLEVGQQQFSEFEVKDSKDSRC
jgi:hypothetical protein